MKKIILFAVFAMFISSVAGAQNQEKYDYTPSRLSIGVSPIGFVTHFNVTLETPMSFFNNPIFNRFSVGTEFAHYYKFQGYEDTTLQPFARWYFSNSVGKGLYLQGKVLAGLELKHFYVGGGADLGWKIPIATHWSVDIYGGLKVANLEHASGFYEDGIGEYGEDDLGVPNTINHNGFMEYFGGPHDLFDFRVMICYKF